MSFIYYQIPYYVFYIFFIFFIISRKTRKTLIYLEFLDGMWAMIKLDFFVLQKLSHT